MRQQVRHEIFLDHGMGTTSSQHNSWKFRLTYICEDVVVGCGFDDGKHRGGREKIAPMFP
jgi:hypothetical protein